MHSASAVTRQPRPHFNGWLNYANAPLLTSDHPKNGFVESILGYFHGFLYSKAIDKLQLLCHVQHAEVTAVEDANNSNNNDASDDNDVIDDDDDDCLSDFCALNLLNSSAPTVDKTNRRPTTAPANKLLPKNVTKSDLK